MRSFIAALSLLTVTLLTGAGVAGAVTVSIVPADTTVTMGDTFTLRVVTTAFTDLKGYQLVHSFDSGKLVSLGVLAGDVLTGAGGSYAAFPLADVTAPTDSTWLDAAMLDGSTAGPGVLEYLVFHATATGTAAVNCEHAELRDSQNVRTFPDCAGGVVRITGPTPVSGVTWGRVKAAYR